MLAGHLKEGTRLEVLSVSFSGVLTVRWHHEGETFEAHMRLATPPWAQKLRDDACANATNTPTGSSEPPAAD